jgi:hypothetical protein
MSAEDDVALSDYGSFLRRHRLLLLTGIALGLIVSGIISWMTPATYTSRASVLVGPTAIDSDPMQQVLANPPNLDTEARIATSAAVGETVAARLDEDDVGIVTSRLYVTVPPNTRILQIAFQDTSPEGASLGAQAAAEAYLAQRGAIFSARRDDRADLLRSELRTVRGEIDVVRAAVTSSSPAGEPQGRRTELALLVRRAGALEAELMALNNTIVEVGQVVQDAPLPRRPSGPIRSVPLASGAALGLLAALATARVWRRQRRVRSAGDVVAACGRAPLAEVRLAAGRGGAHETAPFRLPAESLLRAVVSSDDTSVTIAVTAADDVSGAAEVAVRLAATSARRGNTTALLHAGRTHEKKYGSAPSGIVAADLTRERCGPGQVVVVDYLRGEGPDADADARLCSAVDRLRRALDCTIVLAPPTTTVEAVLLGSMVDTTIVVAAADTTTMRQLTAAVDAVASHGADRVETVLAHPGRASRWRPRSGLQQLPASLTARRQRHSVVSTGRRS